MARYSEAEVRRINEIVRKPSSQRSLQEQIDLVNFNMDVSVGTRFVEMNTTFDNVYCSLGVVRSQLKELADEVRTLKIKFDNYGK